MVTQRVKTVALTLEKNLCFITLLSKKKSFLSISVLTIMYSVLVWVPGGRP